MFRRFEPLMAEDTGVELPSGSQNEEPVETETEESDLGEEGQEAADPVDEEGEKEVEGNAEQPRETKQDAAFAQMRRALEQASKDKETFEKEKAEWDTQKKEYEDALGLFFKGENKVAQAHAHFEEVPVEDVINRMNTSKEISDLKAQNQQLLQKAQKYEFDALRAADLAEIKKAHPEINLSDVNELGEKYAMFRGMGIDAVTAYEGLQLEKGIAPKPIGKAKVSVPEKDTFTRDEVEAMSPSERVKNYDKIRKSMAHWK